jgi:hypothetical protein
MATSRPSFVSRARQTSPIPPAPSGATTSYNPSRVPGDRLMGCGDYRAPDRPRFGRALRFVLRERDDQQASRNALLRPSGHGSPRCRRIARVFVALEHHFGPARAEPDRRQLVVFFTDGSDSSSTTSDDVLTRVAQRTRATLTLYFQPASRMPARPTSETSNAPGTANFSQRPYDTPAASSIASSAPSVGVIMSISPAPVW